MELLDLPDELLVHIATLEKSPQVYGGLLHCGNSRLGRLFWQNIRSFDPQFPYRLERNPDKGSITSPYGLNLPECTWTHNTLEIARPNSFPLWRLERDEDRVLYITNLTNHRRIIIRYIQTLTPHDNLKLISNDLSKEKIIELRRLLFGFILRGRLAHNSPIPNLSGVTGILIDLIHSM